MTSDPEGDEPSVPCGLCGRPTRMVGTERCDPCWELEWRIQQAPEIARKVLAGLGAKKTPRPKLPSEQAQDDNEAEAVIRSRFRGE